jgi:hypothetical protein
MQKLYSWPAPPGRQLLAAISELGEGDTLTVPGLSVFGSDVMRQAVLDTLVMRGVRLRVEQIEPEHAEELKRWRHYFRQTRTRVAQDRGSYNHTGRKRSVDREPIKRLLAKGMLPIEISRKLNIPPSSVYRIRDELRGAIK